MDQKTSVSNPLTGESASTLEAERLVLLGENRLLQNFFSEGLEAFEQADQILQNQDPSFLLRQALALFEYGSEEGRENVLLLANKKFKAADALDPHNTDILHPWGNALALLGERREEHHFFQSAKEKYEQALGVDADSAQLHWDYGAVWYYIGQHSGEALDFQKSLKAFKEATEITSDLEAEFWVDYGASALALYTKVPHSTFVVQAIDCFKRAIAQDKTHAIAWASCAEALQLLYITTHDEDHFNQANDCFTKASSLSDEIDEVYLDWAEFLLESALVHHEEKKIRACIEQSVKAHACDPEHALTLAIWGRALTMLGEKTDQLDLIYEGENKLVEALEIDDQDPVIWEHFGWCQCAFGSYFNDYDYFYQAIEKFQEGLSLDRSRDSLWHAIASAYARIARLEESSRSLIQSFKFFEKALEYQETNQRHIDYAMALSNLGEVRHEKRWLEQALVQFEIALTRQKNALYLHPEWLFAYASTLDLLGDHHDDEKYYTRAIEIFSHVVMVDPEFPQIHHRLAQSFCHLGELMGELDYFHRAIHHLRLATRHDEENESIVLDWGIALINLSQHTPILTDISPLLADAEQKLHQAAKMGSLQAYYHLSCLHSILGQYETAMDFLLKSASFHALPSFEELMNDEWLEGLRSTSQFQGFLATHSYIQEEQ